MIDINLIPENLRKGGKAKADGVTINIPREIIFGVGGGLIVLLLAIHLILGAVWLMAMGRLSFYNAQWQKIQPDKAALDAIHKESGDLKNKIKTIADVTTNETVLWAPKFNAISDALPGGTWIKKMTLDKTGLTIEGGVVSKTRNEINNVGAFVAALKKSDDFMKGFVSLEINSIQGSRSNSVQVTDFSIVAKLPNTEAGKKRK
ncbi:MAG: PilN domain-containing protein [Candidatus Omnitrophica bacterium]|nr:PilN domain-containing protein [Candidatus Omnitrophota bacterium]MDE2221588.1 PilN domain-containing protein [Candidatus Omnitrophota bacterium]